METLPNLTKSDALWQELPEHARAVMRADPIDAAAFHALSMADKKTAGKWLEAKSAKLKGADLERFQRRIEPIIEGGPLQTKERNQTRITQALAAHLSTYGVTPNVGDLVQATGLTRQTVAKHLREYGASELYDHYRATHIGVAFVVMDKLGNMALNGDLKAIRLFLEVMGVMRPPSQSTYVQVNGGVGRLNVEAQAAEGV